MATKTGAARKRVLIVEDEEGVRELLVRLLTEAGYEVREAADYRAGDEWLSKENFDLLIANVLLPGGSGVDLTQRAIAKGMETLLVSGHPEQIELHSQSGNRFVAKPFKMDEMFQRIRHALGEESR
jgi:DNA-binding response OmpR family regulator